MSSQKLPGIKPGVFFRKVHKIYINEPYNECKSGGDKDAGYWKKR